MHKEEAFGNFVAFCEVGAEPFAVVFRFLVLVKVCLCGLQEQLVGFQGSFPPKGVPCRVGHKVPAFMIIRIVEFAENAGFFYRPFLSVDGVLDAKLRNQDFVASLCGGDVQGVFGFFYKNHWHDDGYFRVSWDVGVGQCVRSVVLHSATECFFGGQHVEDLDGLAFANFQGAVTFLFVQFEFVATFVVFEFFGDKIQGAVLCHFVGVGFEVGEAVKSHVLELAFQLVYGDVAALAVVVKKRVDFLIFVQDFVGHLHFGVEGLPFSRPFHERFYFFEEEASGFFIFNEGFPVGFFQFEIVARVSVYGNSDLGGCFSVVQGCPVYGHSKIIDVVYVQLAGCFPGVFRRCCPNVEPVVTFPEHGNFGFDGLKNPVFVDRFLQFAGLDFVVEGAEGPGRVPHGSLIGFLLAACVNFGGYAEIFIRPVLGMEEGAGLVFKYAWGRIPACAGKIRDYDSGFHCDAESVDGVPVFEEGDGSRVCKHFRLRPDGPAFGLHQGGKPGEGGEQAHAGWVLLGLDGLVPGGGADSKQGFPGGGIVFYSLSVVSEGKRVVVLSEVDAGGSGPDGVLEQFLQPAVMAEIGGNVPDELFLVDGDLEVGDDL